MKGTTVKQLQNFEDKVAKLFKAGKIRVPVHLSGSLDGSYERFLIDLFKGIRPEDYVFCTWRNHMHYLLKGGSKKKLLDEILGKETGICGGKAGSMHIIDHKLRFYSSAIVGGTPAIAVGVAAGIKRKGGSEKVYCFVGDGGMDSGHCFEAIRYAEGHYLPIKFVVENNNRSVCTSVKDRWGYEALKGTIDFTPAYPHAGIGEYVPL